MEQQAGAALVPLVVSDAYNCLKALLFQGDCESACNELDASLQVLARQWYASRDLDADIDQGYDLVYKVDLALEGDTSGASSLHLRFMQPILEFPSNWQRAQLVEEILKFTSQLNQKWEAHSTSAGGSSDDQISNYNENDDCDGDLPIGMDEKLTEVEALLTAEAGKHWVGAYGMGGAGKTLLAKTIKEREAIKKHFGDMIFFITFGKLVNLEEVWADLMEQVQKSFPQEVGLTKATVHDIASKLRGYKFLLIVDDVWEEDTESVKRFNILLQNSSSAARIFVTCRNVAVLKRLQASEVHMEKLNTVRSMELFRRHAGNPDVAESLVAQVVEGCDGLPLALKVIGSFMAPAAGDTDSWNRRVDLLQKAKLMDEEEQGTPEGRSFIRRLKLSYDALPTTSDIKYKECFSYLGIVPQGAEFGLEYLSLYWEAEGLVRHASDGSRVFRKLEQHCLVEKLKPGWYKLHDVIHVLAADILEKERRGCYLQSAAERVNFQHLDEFCKRNRLRRLCIRGVAEAPESKVPAAAYTIALFLYDNPWPMINRNFITSFLRLKVLVMLDTSLTVLPEYIGLLTNLVTLDVSHNQALVNIPSASISTLTKLAHLDIRNCEKLTNFPANALLKLSNLSYFSAQDSWGAWRAGGNFSVELELLRRLPRLEGVWIDSALSVIVPDGPRNLVKLYIRSRQSVRLQDATSSFWSKLTRLEELCLERLVNGDMDCGNLCSRLRICKLEYVEPLASGSLQHLTSLEELRLTRSKEVSAVGFTMLKVLELWECNSVSKIPVISKLEDLIIGFCEALEQIEVHGCHELEYIFLRSLPKLARLAFVDTADLGNGSQTLESLPKLRALHIIDCPQLSPSIQGGHQGLEALQFPGGVLWQQFGPFPALTRLYRTGNDQLDCLAHADASALPRLRTLVLGDCQEPLPQLPEWLANQINVLVVVPGCNLTTEWVGALVNLRELPDSLVTV